MHQIIAEIASDNSKLHKEAVLEREARANNTELFQGLRLCYDSMITFGLKKVPTHGGPDGQGLPWAAFSKLADQLAKRELTGHAARDAVELCLSAATQDQWNTWYRPILIKDMRAGFSDTTVNKAAKKAKKKEFEIPVFECQLAHDGANHESKIAGKKLIEIKLDGVRVITIVYPGDRVDQYSRNGKELVNFPHIKEQFVDIASKIKEPWVFDGEVMSSSFQDLMRQVHRKDNVQAQDAVLYLFDCLPLAHFKKGASPMKQNDRSDNLAKLIENYKDSMPNVKVLEYESVDLDTEKGRKNFDDINRRAIAGGYEGIMIKDPSAPYECKRSVSWLKQKPFIEVSLSVIEVEEGTGRNEGRLGALVCEGEDDGKTIKVNVGSGFSDSLRSDYWTARDSVVGRIAEVRADAVTQNQDGTYSLRFPRFLRFRGFEVGEKI